jgi:LPS export ABC transporter protein LptC
MSSCISIRNKMIPAAFLIGCFFLYACENDIKDIKALTARKIGVEEARDVEAYMSRGGKMTGKLIAPLMYRYQDTVPRIEFTQTIHVDFYDDSLKVESTVDALFAKYLEGQSKVFLRDSVVAINRNNQDTLRCKELWWDQNLQKFYTEKSVRIYKRDGTILYGDGMESSQDFTDIKILHPTNSIFKVPASQFPE